MVALQICRRKLLLLVCRGGQLAEMSHTSVTGNDSVDKAMDKLTGGKIGGWLNTYENMVGLTEVRTAQSKVIQAEQIFLQVQTERRSKQIALSTFHSKLKDIHAQLDKVQRGDQRYLDLLTEEYQIIREEKIVETDLGHLETQERDLFAAFSSAVRESHEKERTRTERTKYWSIMGSIIGAAIGIIGTSLNNYLRMRELRGLVRDSTAGGAHMKELISDLAKTMENQHQQMNTFVRDLRSLTAGSGVDSNKVNSLAALSTAVASLPDDKLSSEELQAQTKEVMALIKQQHTVLEREMSELKRVLAIDKASQDDNNVVYVGPQMETLIRRAEDNLEVKIKTSALWTVTFIYGALAVTLPVLYTLLRGPS